LALRDFYKGYKQLDKKDDEHVSGIWFVAPARSSHFQFEKVSKRTHLDIASVNSAICITEEQGIVVNASISAGGVAPIPLYLKNSSAFLVGKKISEDVIAGLLEIVKKEISPISDARGTKEYKSLLLIQLIKAHFITLYSHLDINRIF
jgi:xanthine dehydrogenase small subunit